MSLREFFLGTKIEHPLLMIINTELIETQKKLNEAKKQFEASLEWSKKTHGGATDADVSRKDAKCKQAIKYLQGKLTKIIAEMETGKWDFKYYGPDMDKIMLDTLEQELKKRRPKKEE